MLLISKYILYNSILGKVCSKIYNVHIANLNYDGETDCVISWNGCQDHEISISQTIPRITGNDRRLLSLKLISDGISNTRNDIINQMSK